MRKNKRELLALSTIELIFALIAAHLKIIMYETIRVAKRSVMFTLKSIVLLARKCAKKFQKISDSSLESLEREIKYTHPL